MDKWQSLLKIFALDIRNVLGKITLDYAFLQEIRLRAGKPLMLRYQNKMYYVDTSGRLDPDGGQAYIISANMIRETMEYVSNYSLYAFEEEIRQGFITIQGGHRIGVAGKVIFEQGRVKNIKYISFMNLRISHQVIGCADRIMPFVTDGKRVNPTLVISPPGCGKTTLLRDMIRQLAHSYCVGVVDERSEIAACYLGIPQNDLGKQADVLDCCPKAEGMLMLIRSMAPRIIAVDEIGSKQDVEAIEYVVNCGCILLATIHGESMEDVKRKPFFGQLVESGIFTRYILLNGKGEAGNIAGIYDENMTELRM